MDKKEYFSVCPKCHNGIAHSANDGDHCEQCGTIFLKKCPHCSKAILSGDAKFCRFCGINYLRPVQAPEKA